MTKTNTRSEFIEPHNSDVFTSLVESLEEFGLEKIDVKVYAYLLRVGSSSIGPLAKNVEEDRGKIYRTIKKLTDLEIIKTTMTNPTICHPVSPAEAISLLRLKREEGLTRLKKLEGKVLEILNTFPKSNNTDNDDELFSIIQGKNNIYTKISGMIKSTSNIFYIVTTADDLMRMYYTTIPERILESKKKGFCVRIVVDDDDETKFKFLKKFKDCEIRHLKLPSKGRMIVGMSESLIISNGMPEAQKYNPQNDTCFFTNSNGMVANIFMLCQTMWRKSKPLY